MRIISLFLLTIIILLGVTFASLNSNTVTLHYYLGTSDLPLSVLMVITFGSGLLLGMLLLSIRILKLKSAMRRLKSKIKLTEKEVENLRAIPLKNEH